MLEGPKMILDEYFLVKEYRKSIDRFRKLRDTTSGTMAYNGVQSNQLNAILCFVRQDKNA